MWQHCMLRTSNCRRCLKKCIQKNELFRSNAIFAKQKINYINESDRRETENILACLVSDRDVVKFPRVSTADRLTV
jgi:hypothetical protein